MKPNRQPRAIKLSDLLILIAATAVGLLPVRVLAGVSRAPQRWRGAIIIERLSVYGAPLLAVLTLAVLLLTVTWPRFSWRRSARQPGFVACVATLSAAGYSLIQLTVRIYANGGKMPPVSSTNYVSQTISTSHNAALLILGAWLAIAMAGRWKIHLDWTEWMGVSLGLCWIGIFLANGVYWIIIMCFFS